MVEFLQIKATNDCLKCSINGILPASYIAVFIQNAATYFQSGISWLREISFNYSEYYQISKMELFVEINNDSKLSTISAKSSILTLS